MNTEETFVPYNAQHYTDDEMRARSRAFYQQMNTRRTIRAFAPKPVPREVIENCIRTASTAPSGAHKQPWTFCLVSNENTELRKAIREAAEAEERENYGGRMSERWLEDLKAFGTDAVKPFLEEAPWIVVVFKRVYEQEESEKHNNYYVNESVGLACGFLLAALHNAGLASLTHTPSPMNFLSKVLNRPANERPFLLIPVGHPADDVKVPNLTRKTLEEISVYY